MRMMAISSYSSSHDPCDDEGDVDVDSAGHSYAHDHDVSADCARSDEHLDNDDWC